MPKHGGAPIEAVDELVDFIREGEKPASEWRVGTEHENPSVLTSHDWRGKVSALPWNQSHIGNGPQTPGTFEGIREASER